MDVPGPAPATVLAAVTVRSGKNFCTAANRLMRFFVVVGKPARVSVIGVPVDCSALRSVLTLAVGATCLSTAKAPATCGVACEVPATVE